MGVDQGVVDDVDSCIDRDRQSNVGTVAKGFEFRADLRDCARSSRIFMVYSTYHLSVRTYEVYLFHPPSIEDLSCLPLASLMCQNHRCNCNAICDVFSNCKYEF